MTKVFRSVAWIPLLLALGGPVLCQEYTHVHPQDLNDGWEVGTLEEVGLDHDQVKDVICNLGYSQGTSDFRSLLVAREGKLVVEQYLNSYAVETIHDVRSAGKTFTGALVGIAIDRGLIDGVDERVLSFFVDRGESENPGQGKEDITLEHLLTMSSGMAADANDRSSPGNELQLKQAADFVQFVLDLPMQFVPGERYQYNSAAAYLAGAVVETVSDQTLAEFADEHLFGPLKIRQYFWTQGPGGTTYGMGGLYLTARDFAKLGLLYLDGGLWRGKQVISKEWVEESLRSRFAIDQPPGLQTAYGRLWLVASRTVFEQDFEVFYASGNGGNILAIVPDLSLVVGIQQSAYGRGYPHFRAFSVIDGMIKAALISDRRDEIRD